MTKNKTTIRYLRGLMEAGDLLVDEEGVGYPDELDVVRTHHQLVQTRLQYRCKQGFRMAF